MLAASGRKDGEYEDWPVSGKAVADAILSGEVDRGIVVCGTGIGISTAVNKVRGIHCVVCVRLDSKVLHTCRRRYECKKCKNND